MAALQAALHAATEPGFLKWWLVGVASLRLLSVGLGYLSPMQLQRRVFSSASKEFTTLTARTFAVWTAATCAVTLMTAFNLDSVPLVQLCAATFAIANAFFGAELLVYKTATVPTIAAPFFFASAWRRPGPRRDGSGATARRGKRCRGGIARPSHTLPASLRCSHVDRPAGGAPPPRRQGVVGQPRRVAKAG
jgi:hypothetical protein